MIIKQGNSELVTLQLIDDNVVANLSAGVVDIVCTLKVKADGSTTESTVGTWSLNGPPSGSGNLDIAVAAGSITLQIEATQSILFPKGNLIAYTKVTKTDPLFEQSSHSVDNYISTIGRVESL